MSLKRYADNLVRYIGPVKKDTLTPLDESTTDSVTLRLYIEEFGMVAHPATTRLRTDADDGAVSLLIPHFAVPWLEATDVIEWVTQDGERRQATISAYTPGTDRKTAATNFDTLTVPAIDADLTKGTVLTLVRKGADKGAIPIALTGDSPYGPTLNAEVETDTVGAIHTKDMADDDPAPWIEASEDGETAPNQERFRVLSLSGFSSGGTISAGRRIRAKLGSDITMTEYGTPVVGADDYGFEGTIPDTVTPTQPGQSLRLEVTCIASGGAPKDVESIVVPYVEA